jgi:hypothetical protein
MRLTPVVALALGLAAFGGGMAARPAAFAGGAAPHARATNVVSGRVVDRATGQPVPEAIVTLGGGNPVQRVVASATGSFAFHAVADGAYVVRADRPGYLPASAGQRTPSGGGDTIAVGAGQPAAEIVVSLWRAGSIGGSVVDESGAPMTGVEVHALQRLLVGGAWAWADAATATSDDRGRYHLSNLSPGEFLVVGRAVQDPETGLLMALLTANAASAADVMANVEASAGETPMLDARVPATSLASVATTSGAKPALVTLAPGATRSALELHVKQAHGVHVSGTLTGAPMPTRGLTVHLVAPIAAADGDASGGDQGIDMASAACDDGGTFEFSNVLPGRYRLALTWMPPLAAAPPARPGGPPPVLPLPTEPAFAAEQALAVGAANVTGVRLEARTGFRIAGHVAAMASADAIVQGVQLTALRLDPVGARVMPATPAPSRFVVDAASRVTSSSIVPGRYLLRVTPPRGWTVVSAVSRGHDLLDDPFDLQANIDDLAVTLTSGPLGAATGTVVTAAGVPAAGATVLIFPAKAEDRGDTSTTARRLRQIRVPAWGAFTFGNVPPGDYLVVALAGDPPADWQAPESVRALARSATPVTVSLGQTQSVRLEVSK